MLISVSTSFYRRSHFVMEVYEQLKSQTFTNWEWVVTDDFSDIKNSESILKELALKDKRIKYYTQSRKKELFYNPQLGCKGDVIVQIDSDDVIFPKLLEVYHYNFSKFPELTGACIAVHSFDHNNKWLNCSVHEDSLSRIWEPHAPHARAFRNIFDSFDNGELKYFMNDTNIVRFTENYGKFMFIPRWLYNYKEELNSISQVKFNKEEDKNLKEEQNFIDNRFPRIHKIQGSTHHPYYYSVEQESFALMTGKFNKSSTAQRVLFLSNDIKPYQKDILRELFFDHYISFDINDNEKFDEIIIHFNEYDHDKFKSQISYLKQTQSIIPLTIHSKVKLINNYQEFKPEDELMISQITEVLGAFAWDWFFDHIFMTSSL